MEKVLEAAEKYVLYMVLGLFSVFVLSNYTSPYVVPKEILLVFGVSLIVLIWVAKIIVKGSLTFSLGKFDLGVLLIALSYLVSTFFATPNKMEAYLLPGTTTFVLAGAVLYFLINQFDQKVKNGGVIALFISGLILSLVSLIGSVNVFSKIPQLPAFIKDPSFNPMGGVIPSMIFLSVILFFAIEIFIKEKDSIKKMFYGSAMAVVIFALVFFVATALPGKANSPRFATMQDSWEITVDTLKKSPFIGVGPANYITAFNVFRPVTYNQSDLWQIRFTTASNFYFTLITETGFFGLFALAVLLIAIYKYLRRNLKFTTDTETLSLNLEKSSLIVLVVLFAVLPISPVIIVFLFAVLALLSRSEHKLIHLNVATAESNMGASRVPAIIIGLPFVVGVIAIVFLESKVLSSEATFKKSIDALSANDAKTTYDLMNSAINKNPKVDRYHASFAQVNMALASSLATKKDITDSDRSTISQLVQQAISEGKATVSLNPSRSGNWEVLAQIYTSIMPFAKGADQFAIQTYTQAIALDPTNPNLRIALGGIYYSLGNFDNAIDVFKLAVVAKPDLPNAHYNLAITYREKKDYDNAITETNNVISLVAKDSADYKLAKQTLDDLQSKKSAAKSVMGSTENLIPPQQPIPSNVKPPIELPKEATPPAATK